MGDLLDGITLNQYMDAREYTAYVEQYGKALDNALRDKNEDPRDPKKDGDYYPCAPVF